MEQRNLSGMYFRYQNPETGKWENWCFEDLPEDEQRKELSERSQEWLISACIAFAKVIRRLGDEFDIHAK